MAPAARTDRDIEPPGLIPDIADDLADMLRRGRLSAGTVVASFEYRTVDGRRVYVDLPAPREVEDDDSDPPLSDLEQGILDALRRSHPQRMQSNEIAPLIDDDEDPYGGSFKRAVSRLKLLGLIEGGKKEGGYRLKTKEK